MLSIHESRSFRALVGLRPSTRLPTVEESAGAKALMGRTAWRLDSPLRTAERMSECP